MQCHGYLSRLSRPSSGCDTLVLTELLLLFVFSVLTRMLVSFVLYLHLGLHRCNVTYFESNRVVSGLCARNKFGGLFACAPRSSALLTRQLWMFCVYCYNMVINCIKSPEIVVFLNNCYVEVLLFLLCLVFFFVYCLSEKYSFVINFL
jgi:hypothetical protein